VVATSYLFLALWTVFWAFTSYRQHATALTIENSLMSNCG